MLRPHQPVYDSNVEAFFFLPQGSAQEPLEQKLQRLMDSYNFLTAEYGRVLDEGLLGHAIAQFRDRYDQDGVFTQEKIIDTLIWRFVTILRRRAPIPYC
jgi:hypothetical protein